MDAKVGHCACECHRWRAAPGQAEGDSDEVSLYDPVDAATACSKCAKDHIYPWRWDGPDE